MQSDRQATTNTLKSAFIGLPEMCGTNSNQSYESHTHFQSWNDRAACTAILRSEVHLDKHGFSITPVVVRRTGYHYTLKSAFIGLPEICGTNSNQSYESHTHFQSWNDRAAYRAACTAILRSEVHLGKHGFSITPVVVRRTGYHYTLKSALILLGYQKCVALTAVKAMRVTRTFRAGMTVHSTGMPCSETVLACKNQNIAI